MESKEKEKKCFLCRVTIEVDEDNCQKHICSYCPPDSDRIYYCSEKHLEVHRGKINFKRNGNNLAKAESTQNVIVNGVTDNLTCWPFRIETKPEIGRIMVATRDIRAGEIILEEYPAVWGPNNKSAAVCLGCLKPALKIQLNKSGDEAEDTIKDISINTCPKCCFPICGTECK